MKLFCVFHRRMAALGYHVHCDWKKREQRLFITLDSRYKVTVAEWPLMLPIANRYWHRAFTDPWSARASNLHTVSTHPLLCELTHWPLGDNIYGSNYKRVISKYLLQIQYLLLEGWRWIAQKTFHVAVVSSIGPLRTNFSDSLVPPPPPPPPPPTHTHTFAPDCKSKNGIFNLYQLLFSDLVMIMPSDECNRD